MRRRSRAPPGQVMNRWPGINEWVYAVKTFAAAMAALYIAMSIGLDRPYWAMATVYIVSQPLIGAMRSKSLYRLAGTVIGAAATVALVPNLVDAPELLSAALALWVGVCLYISLLDRTPRSYLFLAGRLHRRADRLPRRHHAGGDLEHRAGAGGGNLGSGSSARPSSAPWCSRAHWVRC